MSKLSTGTELCIFHTRINIFLKHEEVSFKRVTHEAHLLCKSSLSCAEKKTAHLENKNNIWLNVSRIVLAPLFYEIIPYKCLFVSYFVFFSRLPLLPGSLGVLENGDHIIPIDQSSNIWKNPKSFECANNVLEKHMSFNKG